MSGRVLALDFGSARCGVAISDPTGTLATPLEPVLRPGTRKGLNRVVEIARELEVRAIVVGLPLSLSGRDSNQTREVREWTSRLSERVAIPVELFDERFTTKLAAQAGGESSEDSRAAAILLGDWLTLGDGVA